MITTYATAAPDAVLSDDALQQVLTDGLSGKFSAARLLVLIPDHTRTLPLPKLFRWLVALLSDAKQLDFMVALGTHPPLSEAALCALVGITLEEHASTYAH
ncbi:MAG: DUF2088 domain-containing protein, partial [Armatimonadetes bacterium]|nr:DUF2088 domain-containing protein [Anaerolineae bacterium]